MSRNETQTPMTIENRISTTLKTVKEESITLDQITMQDDFLFRTEGMSDAHKADLASTIKNTGKPLDPVLLWRPEDDPGCLILLDGWHRLAAYKVVGWSRPIPAIILVGADRRAALGAALRANAKRHLGLTQWERLDAAWRLVREHVNPRYKVREVSDWADVSPRTVDNMRARLRVMVEEAIEITGTWARDRRTLPPNNDVVEDMSSTQRDTAIDELAHDLRDMIDRRKHPERVILRDREAVWEAVALALGERAAREMLVWTLGTNTLEADEWMQMAGGGGWRTLDGENENTNEEF